MAVVLVTGGSSGIGLATVRRLAASGHTVFAAARAPTRNPLPEGVAPVVLDVGDPDDVAAAIERCIDAPDPPARVVVGADAESMVKLIDGTDPETFAQLLRDFVGAVELRTMRERRMRHSA